MKMLRWKSSKITPKEMAKRLGQLATPADINRVLDEREAKDYQDRKKQVWASIPPQLKVKLLRHVAERRENEKRKKGRFGI